MKRQLGSRRSHRLWLVLCIGALSLLASESFWRPQGASQPVIHIELSDGQPQVEGDTPSVPSASAANLSSEETQALLNLLPPTAAPPTETFHRPAESLPAPRPGKTVPAAFGEIDAPPPTASDTAPEVVFYAPEGEVKTAPKVTITFSNPMVPLGAIDERQAAGVPVSLTPEVPGSWRWVSPKTLVFQNQDALPGATLYSVSAAPETADAAGRALGKALEFNFSTPTAKPLAFYPANSGGQALNPLMAVAFNQTIAAEAVMQVIHLEVKGIRYPLVLAPEATWSVDPAVKSFVARHGQDRTVVFRPRDLLPNAAQVSVQVGPGVPSAEGPRLGEDQNTYNFRTYGELQLMRYTTEKNGVLQPHQNFRATFNNNLVSNALADDWYDISPKPEKLEVYADRTNMIFDGVFMPRTKYTVTLKTAISDVFGQTLRKPITLTFTGGDRHTSFAWSARPIHIPDPYADPTIQVVTTNYRTFNLEVYRVDPRKDWFAFQQMNARGRIYDKDVALPGRKVLDTTIRLNQAANEQLVTNLDLIQYLNGERHGHLILRVEPGDMIGNGKNNRFFPFGPMVSWVQVTQIGFDVLTTPAESILWVNQLKDGTPIKDADVFSLVKGSDPELVGISDEDGAFLVDSREQMNETGPLLVSYEGDTALLTADSGYYAGRWADNEPRDRVLWHVFDDRGMYKPGETVHLKGWLRFLSQRRLTRPAAGRRVTYQLRDARGNELQKGALVLNENGGFDHQFTLPEGLNLGHTVVSLALKPDSLGKNKPVFGHTMVYNHGFQVQEFRRPEFKVSVTVPDGLVYAGETVAARAEAAYYAGGGLPGADINWAATVNETVFTPPNWSQFTFGAWIPWWRSFHHGSHGSARFNFSSKTDAMGFHDLSIKLDEAENELPATVELSATVADVNAQRWSASGQFLRHAAEAYVGLRTNRYFVDKGTPFGVEVIVADVAGKVLSDRDVRVEVVRLEWQRRQARWEEVEVDPQSFVLKSQTAPIAFTFATKEGGTYRITARVQDDNGHINRTTMTRWVSGGQAQPVDTVDQENVTLIPDKQEYQVGDTAKILVQAPFHPAEATMTVHALGLMENRRFTLKDASLTLEVPITEAMVPNAFVRVDLVGKAARIDASGLPNPKLLPRPAYATGQLNLKVPPLTRELLVTPTPAKTDLNPGEETSVSVLVRDPDGKPVAGAEVAVFVVDEAVLSLSGYQLGNPIDSFYPEVADFMAGSHNRAWVILQDAEDMVEPEISGALGDSAQHIAAMAPMAARAAEPEMFMDLRKEARVSDDDSGSAPKPIAVRTNFNPLAAFFAEQKTGIDGTTDVRYKLPDNLTRYRIMAVCVDGDRRFGAGEATATARLPLMIRPSAPRFLNYGDRFELPIVLQNQTDQAMDVNLAVEAQNALLTAGAGRRFTVPAQNRVEVRLPARTQQPGEAWFRVAVQSGDLTDAARVTVPVWTPATSEAFAVYGEIDGEVNLGQAIHLPKNAFREFGGVQVSTTSTALHMLEDAVLYLNEYPYECAEQRASRVMSLLGSKDMIAAFGGDIDEAGVVKRIKEDLKHLRGLQNNDGGFGFWRRGEESYPYVTIHVAHAFARALRADYDVSQNTINRVKRYLNKIQRDKWLEKDYSPRMVFTLRAYALYVRGLMGESVEKEAVSLFETMALEDAPLEALGWLLPLVPPTSSTASILLRHFDNRAEQSAATASFTDRYDEQRGYLILHSSRRTDAVILESLIAVKPDHPLITKLVAGLNAHRTKGRWSNTQENLFVLFALKRYFETYEKTTPDMVARVWLNQTYYGEHRYQGRTTDRGQIDISMIDLAAGGDQGNLILQKEGAGRLYYRLGLRYAPKDLKPEAVDRGFYVKRSYEGVDDPEDVKHNDDGSWQIRRGAKVRVTLQMVAPARRYHVALVDPLPAGLEAVNPALAGTEPVDNPNRGATRPWSWWYRPWFEHQNLRDDRVEAFSTLVYGGVHEFSYIARATTPGEFIAPPPKAEEMYSPETFGRGRGEVVVIQ